MHNQLTKYQTHPQYSVTFKSLLDGIELSENAFLFSEFKTELLERYGIAGLPNNLFRLLSSDERKGYLTSLRKVTRLRKLFACGYELDLDMIEYLLQRVRSVRESRDILRTYKIPYEMLSPLLQSKRKLA